MSVGPAKTQISLGIRLVWSESSLSAWRNLGSLATHWAHSEDWSDWADTQAKLSLRWVHSHFGVFSCRGSSVILFKVSFIDVFQQFEDNIRKNRSVMTNWIKYAGWEESQKEIPRCGLSNKISVFVIMETT